MQQHSNWITKWGHATIIFMLIMGMFAQKQRGDHLGNFWQFIPRRDVSAKGQMIGPALGHKFMQNRLKFWLTARDRQQHHGAFARRNIGHHVHGIGADRGMAA